MDRMTSPTTSERDATHSRVSLTPDQVDALHDLVSTHPESMYTLEATNLGGGMVVHVSAGPVEWLMSPSGTMSQGQPSQPDPTPQGVPVCAGCGSPEDLESG